MPVKLVEVDEVWLALEVSYAAFKFNGFAECETPYGSAPGYAMHLIKRAMAVYRVRGREVPNDPS